MAQHQHLVSQLGNHGQVVADDQQRRTARLDLLKHLQNLRLHRGIQRGGWLVGDHQRRLHGQRAGDQGALTQASRQLSGALAGA
ncbi:hypothetical protein PS623_02715 [Pseudomonas fluorescens]|nr:hypothetical protein PS623_02715 [Pseudomonas fluorescens]